MTVETLSDVACFGGRQLRLQHASEALSCAMTFSVYLPPQAREPHVTSRVTRYNTNDKM